jgi:hypothetical protein
MQIKIFKSHLFEGGETKNIEAEVNAFIRGKKIIDIKQSVCNRIEKDGTTNMYFTIITVMYEQ